MGIQWYPGHMAKTKREIKEVLPLLDLIIEVVDARLPLSSRNPDLPTLLKGKQSILLLNKSDLADPEKTDEWLRYYRSHGQIVLDFNAQTGENLKRLANLITKEEKKLTRQKASLRLGVFGIPNCGKSSVLNRLVGKSAARVGEKPGITRGRQWVKRERWEILDTPGILWPKISDQEVGWKLALVGAIKQEIFDLEELVLYLIGWLQENYPHGLINYYSIELNEPATVLKEIGKKRGCLIKGGEIDYSRAAGLVWSDFRSGRLGSITLEKPPIYSPSL